MKMVALKERYPPRIAAVIVALGFDRHSRKADYRSFVEEFQERALHNQNNAAKAWAYGQAIRTIWETFPPGVREALVLAIIRYVLRG